MAWLIVPIAAALYATFWWLLGKLGRRIDGRRKPRRLTLTEIIAATPGLIVYGCGCRPCPQHAAAQAARDKANAARDEWAAEMNERFHQQ